MGSWTLYGIHARSMHSVHRRIGYRVGFGFELSLCGFSGLCNFYSMMHVSVHLNNINFQQSLTFPLDNCRFQSKLEPDVRPCQRATLPYYG